MSGIQVQIVASEDKDKCSIKVTGELQRIITDDDRAKLGITDGDLKNFVGKYLGKNPKDAFVKSPTPWDDLYKRYTWDQVQTHLRPISAKVLEISSEPVVLAHKTLTNNSAQRATFTESLTDTVTDTVESNWNAGVSLSFSNSIEVSAEIGGFGAKSNRTLTISGSYGQGGSKSQSTAIQDVEEVSVTLDPGKSVTAYLNASRGSMKCRVVYEVSLTGQTAVNYCPKYEGHHFYGLFINEVMKAGGKQVTYTSTEDISVGYFGSGSITVKQN